MLCHILENDFAEVSDVGASDWESTGTCVCAGLREELSDR